MKQCAIEIWCCWLSNLFPILLTGQQVSKFQPLQHIVIPSNFISNSPAAARKGHRRPSSAHRFEALEQNVSITLRKTSFQLKKSRETKNISKFFKVHIPKQKSFHQNSIPNRTLLKRSPQKNTSILGFPYCWTAGTGACCTGAGCGGGVSWGCASWTNVGNAPCQSRGNLIFRIYKWKLQVKL